MDELDMGMIIWHYPSKIWLWQVYSENLVGRTVRESDNNYTVGITDHHIHCNEYIYE